MVSVPTRSLVLLLASASITSATRIITILNRCPSAIPLYINGQSQGDPLPARTGATNRTYEDTWQGLIYTTAGGGESNGAASTRAGFYGQVCAEFVEERAGN